MGFEVGPLRAPLCEMGAENAAKLIQVMKDYGIKVVE
jgi:4-hydroxy-tetrahydrodipicolinate synthase